MYSRDSSVGVVTRLGAQKSTNRGLITSQLFSFPKHQDSLWGPIGLLSSTYRGYPPVGKAGEAGQGDHTHTHTHTHLHLPPTLSIRGAQTALPNTPSWHHYHRHYHHNHHHHHHLGIMQLGHLLTRSGLTSGNLFNGLPCFLPPLGP